MAPAKKTGSDSDEAIKAVDQTGGGTVPTDEVGPTTAEATSVAETAATDTAVTGTADATADDDLRRRYREALERKRNGGAGAATGHGSDRTTAPTSNDKVKRTFRRRAGG
ncbi:MAG: hypothetical protein QOJ62_448 [Actinomycetota bacterium]|nr:hypothetical protein [Actinomycetota bacterium]